MFNQPFDQPSNMEKGGATRIDRIDTLSPSRPRLPVPLSVLIHSMFLMTRVIDVEDCIVEHGTRTKRKPRLVAGSLLVFTTCDSRIGISITIGRNDVDSSHYPAYH
jgi:hypothetical protein